MSKNNRYRIIVEIKTSPSHRMKEMNIAEAYIAIELCEISLLRSSLELGLIESQIAVSTLTEHMFLSQDWGAVFLLFFFLLCCVNFFAELLMNQVCPNLSDQITLNCFQSMSNRSCKEPVLQGFKLWSEVLRCYRWEIFVWRKTFHGISILEDDILSGRVIEDGCDCTSETTEG